MTGQTLASAVAEAHRFLKFAKAAEERILADQYALISGSPETGAVRRASMDLTRALAKMRRTK